MLRLLGDASEQLHTGARMRRARGPAGGPCQKDVLCSLELSGRWRSLRRSHISGYRSKRFREVGEGGPGAPTTFFQAPVAAACAAAHPPSHQASRAQSHLPARAGLLLWALPHPEPAPVPAAQLSSNYAFSFVRRPAAQLPSLHLLALTPTNSRRRGAVGAADLEPALDQSRIVSHTSECACTRLPGLPRLPQGLRMRATSPCPGLAPTRKKRPAPSQCRAPGWHQQVDVCRGCLRLCPGPAVASAVQLHAAAISQPRRPHANCTRCANPPALQVHPARPHHGWRAAGRAARLRAAGQR